MTADTAMRGPALTDADIARLTPFITRVRSEWKKAATPEGRADLERRVTRAMLDRANAVIRRADGRCEHCGDPDKDKRIRRLEAQLADAERELRRVRGLVDVRRKTLRMDDLRAVLDGEEMSRG